jgi:hypothetical protein
MSFEGTSQVKKHIGPMAHRQTRLQSRISSFTLPGWPAQLVSHPSRVLENALFVESDDIAICLGTIRSFTRSTRDGDRWE